MEPLLRIASHDNGERLDTVLARTYPKYSRSFFQKFLRRGGVTLAGAPREPSYRVHAGETFQVADLESFATESTAPPGAELPSAVVPTILFEDASLLVIDKPAGLVVHPAPGHRGATLIDWVRRHLGPKITKIFTDPERLGLVHRLDKDTSGVLLIAKSITAQTAVSRQFHDRTVQKTYTAFVEGVPSAKNGIINAPVGRSRRTPTLMTVSVLGRASETAFEVNEALKEVSQVTLHPKTGRTHQIRVHCSAIGHPIVGDRTYGAKSIWTQSYGIHRPLLHAERLQLTHPESGKPVKFEAPWPEDFRSAQKLFRETFKALMVAALAGVLCGSTSSAETTTHKTSSETSSTSTTRKTGSLSSDVRTLKKEVAALEEKIQAMAREQEHDNTASRLRDLERASLEVNAKAVSSAASVEEAKTQVLDINRKLKALQENLDQLRDQVDRLQQQTIKQQAVEAPAAPTTASPGSSEPAPATPSSSSGRRPWGSRTSQ